MKVIISICAFLTFNVALSQDYVNTDGTVSDYAKKELMISIANKHSDNYTKYSFDNNTYILSQKIDCNQEECDSDKADELILKNSFVSALRIINSFKYRGYDLLDDAGFNEMIFKINTVSNFKTWRYHFKFSLDELKNFPEYMDIKEFAKYVVVQNNNANLVYVK